MFLQLKILEFSNQTPVFFLGLRHALTCILTRELRGFRGGLDVWLDLANGPRVVASDVARSRLDAADVAFLL